MERRCVTSHRLRRLARIPCRYGALPSFAGLRFIPVWPGRVSKSWTFKAWSRVHPRVCGEARNSAPSAGGARGPSLGPSPPRCASVQKLRADGARQRIELRRRHRTERASLARRLGRAVARKPTGSPRVATADVIIDTSVSSAEAPSGVSLSAPAP